MLRYLVLFVILCCSYAQTESETFNSITQNLVPSSLLGQGRTGRIVNGQTAVKNQFPHQAVLAISTGQGRALCGGSLIAPKWILSAAHCIIGARAVDVQLGSVNRNAMPVQRRGIRIIRLASYNPVTLRDDLSLIELESEVPISENVKTIRLENSTATNLSGKVLRVSGFGLTTSNQISSTLQYADVIGITTRECQATYGMMITNKIQCTRGYPNVNSGTCNGDSGGPLITKEANPAQVGIVSFGSAEGCDLGAPQGFTRVQPYVNWIKSFTGLN